MMTDANGVFEIREAAPGRYSLAARAFGDLQSNPVEVVVPPFGFPPVVELPLQRHGIVRVAVEGPDEGPVARARVAWIDDVGPIFFAKQFTGRRRQEFNTLALPQGPQRLFAEAPGWGAVRSRVGTTTEILRQSGFIRTCPWCWRETDSRGKEIEPRRRPLL